MAYLLLAYFAYLVSILGPILPFLREQLRLTYAGVSLHLSALAAGEIAAGLLGDWVVRVLGRWAALWTGAVGMAVGALLLCFGADFRITLSGCALMGLLGSLQLVLIPAILADRHGEQRTVAVTESNVASSVSPILGPLSVGAFTAIGLGWRGAVLAALAFLGIMITSFGRVRLPMQLPAAGGSGRVSDWLPQAFWAYCVVIFFVVSVEFCMVLWGTEFLHTILKLPTAQAASAFGLFFAAMLLGRITGSWFSRRISGRKLIRASLAIAATGFVLYSAFSFTTVSLTGVSHRTWDSQPLPNHTFACSRLGTRALRHGQRASHISSRHSNNACSARSWCAGRRTRFASCPCGRASAFSSSVGRPGSRRPPFRRPESTNDR